MSQQEAILLLGSNIGDTKKNLLHAIELLEKKAGTILTRSEFLSTEPVEFASNNIFCNIALLISTQLSPIYLLKSIKEIEHEMGRIWDTSRIGHYSDRIIDIDIVSYGSINFECHKLKIPHYKHCFERDFSAILINQLKLK